MAEVKQTYIPETNAMFFANSYLDSHQRKLEKAMAFAQAETQNKMDLLEYYRKQEQSYLKYLAKIKGVKGFEDKGSADLLKRQLGAAGLESTDNAIRLRAKTEVEKKFAVKDNQIGQIQSQSLIAANNLSRGVAPGQVVDRAIASAVVTKKNTPAAMSAAIDMYNTIKQTDAQRTSPQFATNEAAIVASLVRNFGLTSKIDGKSPAALIRNQGAFEQIKQKEITREQKKYTSRSITPSDILGSGTTPTTAEGGTAIDTSIEELMLSKIQGRASQLEDELLDATRAEALYERGKQIYQNQYGGNTFGKALRSGRNKRVEKQLANLPPEERFFVDSLASAKGIGGNNPFLYRTDADLEGDNKLAADLLNVMIANKGAAKPRTMKDFITMSGKMATKEDGTIDTKQQQKVLGLALKGLRTFDQESNPETFQAEAQQAQALFEESSKLAEQARQDKVLLEAAQREEQAKAAAPQQKVVTIPTGEKFIKQYKTRGGGTKDYGYRYEGMDDAGQPQFTFLTLGKLEDSTKLNAQSTAKEKGQYEEALKEYQKTLDKMKEAQGE